MKALNTSKELPGRKTKKLFRENTVTLLSPGKGLPSPQMGEALWQGTASLMVETGEDLTWTGLDA